MGHLTGKTAIITGAGYAALSDGGCGSIGYGIATAYAKEGANLVITGRNNEKLNRAKEELEAKYGIRVNCVSPGPFPKPSNQTDLAFNAQLAGKTMLKRFGKNTEIAGAVALLASDASSFMTGSNICVDGGWPAW